MTKSYNQLFWQGIEKASRFCVGLFVTGSVARHYGPEGYQFFVIMISVLSFAATISTFGTNSQVVKSYIQNKIDILIELKLYKLYFSLCIISSAILIGFNCKNLQNITSVYILMAIGCLYSIGRLSDLHKFRAEAESNLKYFAQIELIVFLTFSILRVLLLYLGFPSLFLLTYGIDIFVLFILTKRTTSSASKMNLESLKNPCFKQIAVTSIPIFISNLMMALILSFDKFFLFQYAEIQKSFYLPGTVLISVMLFLPVIIGSSFAGTLSSHFVNYEFRTYFKLKINIYVYATIGTSIVSIVTGVFSDTIVNVIFGPQFSQTSDYLSVLIWTLPIITFVSLRNRFLMIEDGFSTVLISTLMLMVMSLFALIYNHFFPNISLQYLGLVVWSIGGLLAPLLLPSIRHHFKKDSLLCR